MEAIMAKTQYTESLVRRASGGDRSAFDRLVESCTPDLTTHIRLRLGRFLARKVEVEDILQAAFLKAFEGIAEFEYRGEKSFTLRITITILTEVM